MFNCIKCRSLLLIWVCYTMQKRTTLAQKCACSGCPKFGNSKLEIVCYSKLTLPHSLLGWLGTITMLIVHEICNGNTHYDWLEGTINLYSPEEGIKLSLHRIWWGIQFIGTWFLSSRLSNQNIGFTFGPNNVHVLLSCLSVWTSAIHPIHPI